MLKTIVLVALASVVTAEGERLCNKKADPVDCEDLAGLCGNPLISAQCPVLCDSCGAPAVERRATRGQAEIVIKDGNLVIAAADGKNVLIEGGDDVQVDLLAIEPAIQAELKKSVDAADALAGERERKAEKTTAELLVALSDSAGQSATASSEGSEKLAKSIDEFSGLAGEFFTKFINITLEGSAGTQRRSSGSSDVGIADLEYSTAYPHQVSDQGGYMVITFPFGTELIVDSSIAIYHCEWKMSDGTKRSSVMTSATTPRSIRLPTPQWGEAGTLPSASKWDTGMVCYENGAKIVGPEKDLVFTWVPSHPAFAKQSSIPEFVFGDAETQRGKSVTFELEYPYGEQGFQDLVLTFGSGFKAKDGGFVQRPSFTGDVKTSTRNVVFDLKGQKTGDDGIVMEIPVVVTSKKTKFKATTTLQFRYKAASSFGGPNNGNKDIMHPEAMKPLWLRMGRPVGKAMKLCYSSKRDGWSTSTFHNKCDGQGRLFSVQRLKNGRVFGGHTHRSMERPNTYRSCGNNAATGVVTNSGWLFRVEPNDNKKITILNHQRHGGNCYYMHSSYAMTWGGGHDLSCESDFNHCYSNLGHNYGTSGYGPSQYGSGGNRNYVAGRYSWNARNDMSDYEVYLVDKDP